MSARFIFFVEVTIKAIERAIGMAEAGLFVTALEEPVLSTQELVRHQRRDEIDRRRCGTLATATGWNFRDPSVGNPGEIYQLLGSYVPFARTKAAGQATGDPRLSVEERYRGPDDYLERIRTAAMDLIRRRYALAEDLDAIVERAKTHWSFANR